jgi:hypothetical protein
MLCSITGPKRSKNSPKSGARKRNLKPMIPKSNGSQVRKSQMELYTAQALIRVLASIASGTSVREAFLIHKPQYGDPKVWELITKTL